MPIPTQIPVDPADPIIIEKTMLISTLLKDRGLTDEEWAPVVASPLIYYTKLKGARIRGGIWRGLILFMCAVLFFGAGPIPSILKVQSVLTVASTIGVISLALLTATSWVLFTKRMIFRADSMTADLLGVGATLSGLNKFEALREHDQQSNVKWPIRHLWTLKKRIDHLNNQSSGSI